MDVQLKELIETIKTEGVKEADDQAARIVKDAEAKSREILDQAKKDADRITADARAEASKLEQSGRQALKQASRDLLLKMEGQVTKFFDALLQKETADAFTGKVMEDAIVNLLQSWKGGDSAGLVVQLPEREFRQLEASLKNRLAEKMRDGLEIKPFSGLDAGFRIGEKDGSAYYNFTAQGLADMLSELLNPRLSAIMKEAAAE